MRLLHVTHELKRYPIKMLGLRPKAQTPKSGARLYAVEPSKLYWACLHVMNRHNIKAEELIVIDCGYSAFPGWKRYNRGIWYTDKTLFQINIQHLKDFLRHNPALVVVIPEIYDILD